MNQEALVRPANPESRKNYPWGLLVGSLVLSGILTGLLVGLMLGRNSPSATALRVTPVTTQYAPSSAQTAPNAFMVLRLPEIYASAGNAASVKARVEEWLDALKKAGFQPMLLSDVLASTQRHERLPDKAVVLMFQPGYKQTRRLLAPVLARYRYPALWLTDRRAVDKGDKRYINTYDGMEMKNSGLFDLGFYKSATSPFVVDPAYRNRAVKGETFHLAPGQTDGRAALNLVDKPTMNRLNVNLRWSGQQLVQRLMSEMPITERTRLTVFHMFGRSWGVAASPSLPGNLLTFDLQAVPGARSNSIRWDGTAGNQDIQVELETQSVNGELWTYLRYDHTTGTGIMVGFTPGRVIVQQAEKNNVTRIASFPWTRPSYGSISAKMSLTDNRLSLNVPGVGERTVDLPIMPASPQGELGLRVSDRISGVAQAKNVLLYATPLAKKY